MAVITLSRADMLAAIARGESVSLGAAGILTRADQVPSQAALDAGQYDPAPGVEGQQSIDIAARMPRPNLRRSAAFKANATGSNLSAEGDAFGGAGTFANVSPATSGDPAYQLNTVSTAATLNAQGWVSGNSIWRWASKMLFQALARTGPSIAVERIYVGLTTIGVASLLGVDTPGASGYHVLAFRYSTAAGDTTWKAVASNGVSQTVVDTGVVVAINTSYKFEIQWNVTSATFLINGIVVATITATLPNGQICSQAYGLQTLEAVAKTLGVGWTYVEME